MAGRAHPGREWVVSVTLAVSLAAAGCAWRAVLPGAAPSAAVLPPPGPLAVGVGGLPPEDAAPLARVLAGTGARAANAPCSLLRWSAEAAPAWEAIDAWIAALQAAGFADLELCLDFAGPVPGASLLAARSPLPDEGDHEAAAAWVARVVERYDGDGLDDMPDLGAPVRRFRLGSGLDVGGVEPFGVFPALLARVRAALREASAEARLVLPPLRARGEVPGILAWRIEALLASDPPLFDAWSLEASGRADELDAWLAWLARRTPGLEVEVVGATPHPLAESGAPARCEGPEAERARLDAGMPESARCALAALFVDLLAGDPGAVAWARAIAARDLATKALVAASRGVLRAELGTAHDARWWTDPALEAGAGLAAWSGLLDARSGGAHPAYYALRQIDTLMRGRDRVERLDDPAPGAALFLLDGVAGPAWVAWYAPPGFVPLGQPLPVRSVGIDVGVERIWLEQLITEPGTTEPLGDDRDVVGGRFRLDLTPTPVFVTRDPGD